jgi:crotonobetainyl-CoA:carnitine CoA-transferase CaiB-like acyl-CoA transferase
VTEPLRGIRIVDLSRVLAGPLATMTLGDLGADVIKVERPEGGDETRGWGPPFDERGEAAYYLATNRNKLSIAIDFGREADQRLIQRLMADADVVVENFRPGSLDRRGLGPAAMLAAHPRLLWCTITGFGLASHRPGYDYVVQAESGWMAITGEPGGAPMKHGIALADVIAGKDAAIAILAALAGRREGPSRPAAERHLAISLSHSATAALVNVAQNALVTGASARRWGNEHPNLVPYTLFEAADRAIVIAVGSDAQWTACAKALGLEAMAAEPALATNAGRVVARERVNSSISAALRARPAAEWIARLDSAGVPCGVVRPVLEALADHETSPLTGVHPLAPATVRRPPPKLDEHGALIRAKGWDAFASGV